MVLWSSRCRNKQEGGQLPAASLQRVREKVEEAQRQSRPRTLAHSVCCDCACVLLCSMNDCLSVGRSHLGRRWCVFLVCARMLAGFGLLSASPEKAWGTQEPLDLSSHEVLLAPPYGSAGKPYRFVTHRCIL